MRPTITVSDLFSTRGRVDVLRVLWRSHVPMTAAHVARVAQLTYPATSAVLDKLVLSGVADSAPAGRGHTYWLIRENAHVKAYVDPLFRAEDELPERLEADLRRRFERGCVSVVLFGSYARGDQTLDSDVDVIAVAQTTEEKARIERALPDTLLAFKQMWGAALSVIVYTPDEAASLQDRSPALYESLRQDGIRVSGLLTLEWGSLGTK